MTNRTQLTHPKKSWVKQMNLQRALFDKSPAFLTSFFEEAACQTAFFKDNIPHNEKDAVYPKTYVTYNRKLSPTIVSVTRNSTLNHLASYF